MRSIASAVAQVEPHVLRLDRRLVAACELDELRDQRGHLRQLLGHVAEQLLALPHRQRLVAGEHLDVRAQARQRRPQLVRGIRDELALRPRGVLQRAQHRVEAGGEARQLVRAAHIDPAGEIPRLGHLLGSSCEPLHGCEHRSCDEQSEPCRKCDSDQRKRDQVPADPVECTVRLFERAGELDGVALAERQRQHADVRPLDVCVLEEGCVDLASRSLLRALRRRKLAGGFRGRDRLPVPPQELHEHFGAAEPFVPDPEELPAEWVADDVELGWELSGARLQRLVDLAAQLVADEPVGDRRGADNGDGHRRSCRERQASTEAHGSRRA